MMNRVILDRVAMGKNVKPPGSQRQELLIAPQTWLFQGSDYSTIIAWLFCSPFFHLVILSQQDTVFDGLLIQIQQFLPVLYSYVLLVY